MEEELKFTRTELIAAFAKWNADCAKNDDGTLKGPNPNNPQASADILIGYLKKN